MTGMSVAMATGACGREGGFAPQLNGKYRLARSHRGDKSSDEMIALSSRWVDRFPIISLEDGLAETDWEGFRRQTAALGGRIQIVGDDLLVTNPVYIQRAIA